MKHIRYILQLESYGIIKTNNEQVLYFFDDLTSFFIENFLELFKKKDFRFEIPMRNCGENLFNLLGKELKEYFYKLYAKTPQRIDLFCFNFQLQILYLVYSVIKKENTDALKRKLNISSIRFVHNKFC